MLRFCLVITLNFLYLSAKICFIILLLTSTESQNSMKIEYDSDNQPVDQRPGEGPGKPLDVDSAGPVIVKILGGLCSAVDRHLSANMMMMRK